MSAFSNRTPRRLAPNRLARQLVRLRREKVAFDDLTLSNPTRAGLAYPPDLLDALASPQGLRYHPSPLGLAVARDAVASSLSGPARAVDPRRIVLTASTSDAYGMLFKLLCDPGDAVAVPRPSYPLFEHLTRLEGVAAVPYPLEFHGRWSINHAALRQRLTPRTRAVLMVNPNNPTGSFVDADDLEAVTGICWERGLALIVDEVFGEYPMTAGTRAPSVLDRSSDVLTFVLGGLSKAVGLPQLKLSWTILDGTDALVTSALERLELIADTYLNLSTPVQLATPAVLRTGAALTAQIADRVRGNLSTLLTIASAWPAATVLPVEGGWHAVVQVPGLRSEEALVLDLLAGSRVLVHPGYFFDFPREAFLVLSLLPDPAVFTRAARRLLEVAVSPPGATWRSTPHSMA